MDPATGASTCALGSQRCSEKIGVFAAKAVIVIAHHKVLGNNEGVAQRERRKELWKLQ